MFLLLALACAPKVSPTSAVEVASATADATAGSRVFRARCAKCHGVTGDHMKSADVGRFGLSHPPEDVVSVVIGGGESMPSFNGRLTAQQIADVAAWVHQGLATK